MYPYIDFSFLQITIKNDEANYINAKNKYVFA